MKNLLFHLMEQFEYYNVFSKYMSIFNLEILFIIFVLIFFLFPAKNKLNYLSFFTKKFLRSLFNNLKIKYKNEDFFLSHIFIFYAFFFTVFS